jgi:hypothetical protein
MHVPIIPNIPPIESLQDRSWDERYDWTKPSRLVVVCDGRGRGSVLWYVGGQAAFEVEENGFYDLEDLGLSSKRKPAPPGISVWEGRWEGSVTPSSPNGPAEYDSWPNGEFRPLTEDEWSAVRAGRCPWNPAEWRIAPPWCVPGAAVRYYPHRDAEQGYPAVIAGEARILGETWVVRLEQVEGYDRTTIPCAALDCVTTDHERR